MPIERVSRGFKDISSSFKANPLNYDLISLNNETAIARSIRNLILTVPGEKFFNSELGSRVNESLFENFNSVTAINIESDIRTTIENYEPRVLLNSVKVTTDYDNYAYDVVITYDIVGINLPTQSLNFVLEPTR
jgi:phage baseplate assembly protein W